VTHLGFREQGSERLVVLDGFVGDKKVLDPIGGTHDGTGSTDTTTLSAGVAFIEADNVDGPMRVVVGKTPTAAKDHRVGATVGGTKIPTVGVNTESHHVGGMTEVNEASAHHIGASIRCFVRLTLGSELGTNIGTHTVVGVIIVEIDAVLVD
jgi:hypothetical protein